MKNHAWARIAAGIVVFPVGAAVLAGCAPTNSERPVPGGMMGGSGYQYSRLSCAAPAGLPGSTVTVTAADMGMNRVMGGTAPLGSHMVLRAAPTSVPTGEVSFVVRNRGWRTHELVVVPLGNGQQAGRRVPGSDGTVDESGSVGEASASCAGGTGGGLRAGTLGWTTLTLAAGRYELLCNEPNHYADGMWQELVVTP